MILKINSKPIEVKEEPAADQEKSPVYWGVSSAGYIFILALMDYSCFLFFGVHPFPFLVSIFKFFGGLFAWL